MLNQNKLHEYARSFYLDINPVGGSGIFFRTFIYSGTDFVNKVVMTKSGFQTHLFLFTFILSCLCYHTSCRNTKPHYSTISYDSLIAMEEENSSYIISRRGPGYKQTMATLIDSCESLMYSDNKKIYQVDLIPEKVFEIIRSIQEDCIRKEYGYFSESLLVRMLNEIMLFREEIGDANEPFNSWCTIIDGRPFYQLQYAVDLGDYFLICYKHGRGLSGPDTHLSLIDLTNGENTITFRPDNIGYSDELEPLGFRHVSYFKGESFHSDIEDVF